VSKFFLVVLEDEQLWVDGVKKRPSTSCYEFFKRRIEKVVGEGVDTRGFFEACDEGHFYPDKKKGEAIK